MAPLSDDGIRAGHERYYDLIRRESAARFAKRTKNSTPEEKAAMNDLFRSYDLGPVFSEKER